MSRIAHVSSAHDRSRSISSSSACAIGLRRVPPSVFERSSPAPCQGRGQSQVHQHHNPDHRVKPPRPDHVAVVGSPVQLQAGVDPLHRGASLVQALELLGHARNRREPPQVQLALDPRHQAIAAFLVAPRVAGASPAFMTRRTTVLQRPTLHFMANVGHPVPDHRRAHLVITVDRPGFVVHQVRSPRVSRQHPFRLALPQGAVLDQRLDPGRVQQADARPRRRPPCRRRAFRSAPPASWRGLARPRPRSSRCRPPPVS